MTAFAVLQGDWRRMHFQHHAVMLEDLHDTDEASRIVSLGDYGTAVWRRPFS
jgi:hypothetical protein